MNNPKSITLEMSLKPFKSTDSAYIEQVCRTVFTQWQTLLTHADRISIMFWTADGSEILEYRGNMDDRFEWAQFIGGANPRQGWNKKTDPDGVGLHTRYYDYMENPPVMTYRILKEIIDTVKRVGREITGKPIFVGETFDPGPEFAKSNFKYTRHNEICEGASMGVKSMVCCYGILNGDDVPYAAYPNGIPDGTPFGTFLGKQSQIFLTDMGFDYIWLSNGFGFGTETWGVTGALYNGKEFFPEKLPEVEKNIIEFWNKFRQECNFRIETRGTNLTAGIDFSSDGVNHKMIYEGVSDLLPPPNSPWAALDGNFGLELAGYLSRAAELPGEDYLFRFYIHDPWWLNSPWIDRYEGQPHDIYLPMSCARINKEGKVVVANHLNVLTIDNSYGDMPERCPNEVTPYLISAYENAPDSPSPFVWVYPFREYNCMTSGRLEKSFFEDWYFIAAVNRGLPVSTVVSTDNFVSLYQKNNSFLSGSVLVSPVPEENSVATASLSSFIRGGGALMLYGSLKGTDREMLALLNLCYDDELFGIFTVTLHDSMKNELVNGQYSNLVKYDGVLSDGGVDTVIAKPDEYTEVLVSGDLDGKTRILAVSVSRPEWNGGSVVWSRGKDCSRKATAADDAAKLDSTTRQGEFPLETIMRYGMKTAGYNYAFKKYNKDVKEPVIMMHRKGGSVWYSGYCPDTTVELNLKTPLGAPLFLANETVLQNGGAMYHLPRAWRHECRIFVEQEDNTWAHCIEAISTKMGTERRLQINGLTNATVRVLPKNGDPDTTELLLNSPYPHCVGDEIHPEIIDTVYGKAYELKNITGTLLVMDLIK